MKHYHVPEPSIVTCETPYGAAYAWECLSDRFGIRVLGDTRLEAGIRFIEAMEDEFSNQYSPFKEKG